MTPNKPIIMNSESVLPNSLTKIRNEIDVAKPPIEEHYFYKSFWS